MRLGLVPPYLHMPPRYDPPLTWEEVPDPDPGVLLRVAATADRLGYDHIVAPDHVALSPPMVAARAAPYWEPATTLGFFAAVTERIRLATSVLNLPLHHPLEVVKTYGTLDVLCRGRVVLGVGIGSWSEEFDLLGVAFEGRGDRVDDAIGAIRAGFADPVPAYHGTHYDFEDFAVVPNGVGRVPPIWIGGLSRRSLRRAIEHGDCWHPGLQHAGDLGTMLAAARDTEAWSARATPLEIVPRLADIVDPTGDAPGMEAMLAAHLEHGIEMVTARLFAHSVEHYLEQLEAALAVAAAVR